MLVLKAEVELEVYADEADAVMKLKVQVQFQNKVAVK